jgi:dynein heavy chain
MIGVLQWDTLYSCELKSAGQFENITQHVCDNWEEWKAWYQNDTENPYTTPIPGEYNEKLASFDKLVLIKVFRPELVQESAASYVINELGKFYAEAPSTSMNVMYEDINKVTPLIFVLSQGADPTSQLIKFAKEMDFEDKLTAISLG